MKKNNHFKKAIIVGFLLINILTLPAISQTTESSAYNILSTDGYRNDTISLTVFPEVIKQLNSLYIKTGRIYFSGNGFVNTVAAAFHVRFNIPNELKKKITNGTKITFENCHFTNENGVAVKTIHKSIIIKAD